jgi:glycosyltransferase involved in cell wall biosynthesis
VGERLGTIKDPILTRVLVISQLPPPVHGSTIMTRILLDALEEGGVSTRIVDRRFSQHVSDVGKFSFRKVVSSFGLLIRLRRELTDYLPTHVIFFCTNRKASFLVDWAISEVLRRQKVPLINYIHTQGYTALGLSGWLWKVLVGRLLTASDHTVSLSKSLEPDVARWARSGSVSSIPNTTQRVPEQGVAPLSTKPNVLFLSNLIPEKGAMEFIEMAKRVVDSGYAGLFHMVGATADSEFVDSLIAKVTELGLGDRLSIRGAANTSEKWDYLKDATVLVFPSRYRFEAQPLVVLESLAVGTPVVAFAIGGIRDMLQNGITGFCIEEFDELELAHSVSQIMGDPELRAAMSSAARQNYSITYGPESYKLSWMRLLEATRAV